MDLLDIYTGIGGFSLGMEEAGFNTVGFCEVCPDARAVIKKNWPNTPIFEDVRLLNAEALRNAGIKRIDAIAGGFPCQDISVAGKRAGIEGERSGLWKEYARIIEEFEPEWGVIENVAALRGNGLATVLKDLWKIGYDAEWHVIPASAVGLPHQRERLWIITYPRSKGLEKPVLEGYAHAFSGETQKPGFGDGWVSERFKSWLRSEPLRMGDGISGKLASNAIKQYGNSVTPIIPKIIGQAILEVEAVGSRTDS